MTAPDAATFDDNQSAWLQGAPDDEPCPPLQGELTVDVAIIGGGFTGISTAYELSRRHPNLGIALLEAKRIGNGASGRSGGMMLNGVTVADASPETIAREHAVTTAAMEAIFEVVRRHGLRVRMRRDGGWRVQTTHEAAEAAHALTEKLAELGLPLRFLRPSQLQGSVNATGVAGAVFDPTEGVLNGVDLLRGMKPVVRSQGVQIYEATPVLQVVQGKPVLLITPNGTVRSQSIVLATNGYTPRLGFFRDGILPVISHVIATDPVPDEKRVSGFGTATAFSDDRSRLAYSSVDSDGRIVFGGGSNRAYGYHFGNRTAVPAHIDDRAGRALQQSFRALFPALGDVAIRYRWSGPLGLTRFRHCAMGVTGAHGNIYYALGYSGHGVVLANLAGRVLADLYEGNPDPWQGLAFFMDRPHGIPPEPLRWLGYHAYTWATGQSPWKREQ
jgi:glycine/D-amino acid oxidase-like deaminating enzyme